MMMNKMILSMAIAAITFGGFSASAKEKTQKEVCPVTGTEQTACGQQVNRPCPFDGMNLTDAQKKQLKQLCQNRTADKKAKKEAKREARKQSRREQLAKIKAILTPEQYVQFLENSFVNGRHGRKSGQRYNCSPNAPQCHGHGKAPHQKANR